MTNPSDLMRTYEAALLLPIGMFKVEQKFEQFIFVYLQPWKVGDKV